MLVNMARVLGRVRLSRFTKESTSVERQKELIEGWAKLHDHEIVGWAIDTDFSRGVDPWEAPEFKEWLKRPDDFDIMAAWKVDRFGAGSIILNKLLGYCNEHGKTLVSVTESFDTSNWIGRMLANLLAGVAEGEWENTKERTKGSQDKIRRLNRWHGGALPFGYRTEKMEDNHHTLVVDDEDKKLLHEEILPKLLGKPGWSVNAIVTDFIRRGIKTKRGNHWSFTAMNRMLRSKHLLGYRYHAGKLLVDEDGMPLMWEPVMDPTEWETVQGVLDANKLATPRGDHGTGVLLNVAECSICHSPYYRHVSQRQNRQTYAYWRCKNRVSGTRDCKGPIIREDQLLPTFDDLFLQEIGSLEMCEKRYVPGNDVASRKAVVQVALDTIRKEKDLGLYDGDEESYLERLKGLIETRNELDKMTPRKAGFDWVPLGMTYAKAWSAMNDEQKRQLCVDNGIKLIVYGENNYSMYVPQELLERNIPGYEPPFPLDK
jgi:site-specific DNA recombinase